MKSFLSDRQRLPLKPLVVPASEGGLVRVAGSLTAGQAKRECSASAGGATPQVEAVKQGDKVVRLIVTCSCGERIEIDCLYPAGG